MSCENSINVPVCGLTLKLDPAEFPAPGLSREEVEQMIQDALAGVVGGAFVPDYANMETINRITAWGGSWTADRTGFVYCQTAQSTAGYGADIFINDKNVAMLATSGKQALRTILAVAAGDVIKVTGTAYGVFAAPSCYFIPPKAI